MPTVHLVNHDGFRFWPIASSKGEANKKMNAPQMKHGPQCVIEREELSCIPMCVDVHNWKLENMVCQDLLFFDQNQKPQEL